MALYYNSAFPQNIKDSYSQYDQVDFLVKQVAGREVIAGSFRITGLLNVTKALKATPTQYDPIEAQDAVFCNPYAGAHVFIQNATASVNDRTLESIAFYPRPVIMDTIAKNTLEELTACSDSAVEMKGNNGNVILAKENAPFSISPNVCINKSSANIPSSKYPMMKFMFTLSSALDALYVSKPQPNPVEDTDIIALNYSISQLQMHWLERPEEKVQPSEIVFNTNYLVTQTVQSTNTNLNVVAPNPYDSVAATFIKQVNRNNLYKDGNMCEYLRDIIAVEFTLNNQSYGPLTYRIGSGASPPYQDLAVNALKALKGNPDKNSIVNRILQENGAFTIGMAYATHQLDKLGVVMQMASDTDYQYSDPEGRYDCLLYVNGYVAL
jgi:hypothetical protein